MANKWKKEASPMNDGANKTTATISSSPSVSQTLSLSRPNLLLWAATLSLSFCLVGSTVGKALEFKFAFWGYSDNNNNNISMSHQTICKRSAQSKTKEKETEKAKNQPQPKKQLLTKKWEKNTKNKRKKYRSLCKKQNQQTLKRLQNLIYFNALQMFCMIRNVQKNVVDSEGDST